ncbi:oxidoreductase [Phenylobacterium sp. Root77]|jgi:NADP-dependent 3-hydroxy acid dehydrogenase YdfG|uniref:SDR family oxidoreductase n=1 Tax=unclassified Phenylobacterium TaxID=2640670 RepID=UPI0006F3BA6C|nr:MULTISPECIES: SDR family oxidoreductase [unclassified Phenylobacterium]KQW69327.1 oxidoreductase [Phenylobacterium sp. Root1277]KQW95307.1 oxidoreductase [Phenylobacterium sp. Root1290]KRC41098.1 oxidoreductase [Phenylobacterium sp. Root77]
MSDLNGKVIAITGASSGIGEAAARLLAARGAKLMLGARRGDRLQTLAADIEAAGGEARFRTLDVTDRQDAQAFVDAAVEAFGRLDVLVNNAGVMPLAPMEALKFDEWDQMIDVNIRGVLHGIGAALPVMKRQGGGRFINVASIGAHVVVPAGAVYCATKFAVWAISEGLRQESTNIGVTVISPGVTETELGAGMSDEGGLAALKEFRKIALAADDIARAIAFAADQPAGVDVNEIVVRPTASAF